jgi:hypothetical protein
VPGPALRAIRPQHRHARANATEPTGLLTGAVVQGDTLSVLSRFLVHRDAALAGGVSDVGVMHE